MILVLLLLNVGGQPLSSKFILKVKSQMAIPKEHVHCTYHVSNPMDYFCWHSRHSKSDKPLLKTLYMLIQWQNEHSIGRKFDFHFFFQIENLNKKKCEIDIFYIFGHTFLNIWATTYNMQMTIYQINHLDLSNLIYFITFVKKCD